MAAEQRVIVARIEGLSNPIAVLDALSDCFWRRRRRVDLARDSQLLG